MGTLNIALHIKYDYVYQYHAFLPEDVLPSDSKAIGITLRSFKRHSYRDTTTEKNWPGDEKQLFLFS